jgi:membrane fusion protein, multidrug efflux system
MAEQDPTPGQQNKAPEEPPKPPLRERLLRLPREHPLKLLIGAIVLAAIVIGGLFYWRYLQSYESTDDAFIDGHMNMVSSRIAGTVTRVYVEENQHVSAGQVLADLDPRDYEVELQRALASVAQAEAQTRAENPNVAIARTTTQTDIATASAQLANAEASVGEADRERDVDAAKLAQARANNAKAQADLARYSELIKRDEISRQEYDQHVAAAKAAEAEVDAQAAAVAASSSTIAKRRATVTQTEAELSQARQNAPGQVAAQRATLQTREAAVRAAQASVAQARLNLQYTKILAPVDGMVGRKSVEVGAHVQAGQQLMAVVPLSDIWVTANFKEDQLRKLRPGQSATIHVDAYDRDYDGYVESLPAASAAKYSLLPPENATGNFVKVVQRLPVRLRFKPGQDKDRLLRPGMSVVPKVWIK